MTQRFSANSRISIVFAGVSDANVSRETFLVQEKENASRDGLFLRVRVAQKSNCANILGESANNHCGCWVIRRERFTRNGNLVQENETRTVFKTARRQKRCSGRVRRSFIFELSRGALRDFQKPEPASRARSCPRSVPPVASAPVVRMTERARVARFVQDDTKRDGADAARERRARVRCYAELSLQGEGKLMLFEILRGSCETFMTSPPIGERCLRDDA